MALICPNCLTVYPDDEPQTHLIIGYACGKCRYPLQTTADPEKFIKRARYPGAGRGDTVGLCNTERLMLSSLKREALLFDKLGVSGLLKIISTSSLFPDRQRVAELEWLYDNQLIMDVHIGSETMDDDPVLKRLEEDLARASDNYDYSSLEPKYTESAKRLENAQLRLIAAQQNSLGKVQAISLFSTTSDYEKSFPEGKQQVLEIVLAAMPEPDESTPWAQILEYRSDPDSKAKLLGLKVWINEIARSQLNPREVNEKLQWCLQEYENHMRFHRMKVNHATFETVVTVGAEIIEDVVKLKISKLAELMFSAERRKRDLLAAELTAPEREIAYIVKARETFHT